MSAKDEMLKPCPFCGNDAEFKPYKRDGLTLKCKSVGCAVFNQRVLRYSLDWLEGKMIESWNTRATDAIKAQRDELREKLATETVASQAVLSGWKLVPIEPTVAMTRASAAWLKNMHLMRAGDRTEAINDAYRSMVRAAPPPPITAPGVSP